MNKTAILGSETYSNTLERVPLAEAGVLGGIGGAGGYYGGGYLAKKMLEMTLANKTPEERQEMLRQMEEDGTLEDIRKFTAGTGALMGAGYAMHKGMDMNRGFSGALESIVNPRYWKDHDVRRRIDAIDKARMQGVEESGYPNYGRMYSSGRTLNKTGALSDGAFGGHGTDSFDTPCVPVSNAIETIDRDPFLTVQQKDVSRNIIASTPEGDSGLTSGRNLMRSALQLGVGAGAGYLFGRAASAIFSLPPSVTQGLSNTGAIAGALVNSGIFSELL